MRWFRPWGWIALPVSPAGWLVTLAAAAFVAWSFMAVDRNSHSVSDTLIGTLPWAFMAAATLL